MRSVLEDPIIYNPGQTFLGKDCNIHIFLSFVGSLLKQCNLFGIFLQFSLPPAYTKLKLGKKILDIVCRVVREGLDLFELENAPEITQKCPKTCIHDCS